MTTCYWHCDKCGKGGSFRHAPGAAVLLRVRGIHWQLSWECEWDVRRIKVAREPLGALESLASRMADDFEERHGNGGTR